MLRPAVLAPLVAAVALATVGCGAPAVKGRLLVEAARPAAGEASLSVRPALKAAARSLQAAATNALTAADVDHVVLKLYLLHVNPLLESETEEEKASIVVPASRMGERITFARLLGGRTYRVRGEAYATADASRPLHDPDADEHTDIDVDAYLEQDILDVGIQLKAVPRLIVQDFAGGGALDYLNEFGTAARFGEVTDLVYVERTTDAPGEGFLYVADLGNFRVRRVDPRTGEVMTFAGGCTAGDCTGRVDLAGEDARFDLMYGIGGNATHLYVADTGNNAVRSIDLASHAVATVAGGNTTGGYVDNVAGASAEFDGPQDVAAAADGTVYVADTANNVIRMIATDANRTVTTIAGDESQPGAHFDGDGPAARFNYPSGLALGPDGALYVADQGNHAIRRVELTPPYAVTTVSGGDGSGEIDGPDAVARFSSPSHLDVAPSGTIYVTDANGHTLRKVSPDGTVQTIAGVAFSPGGEEGPTTVARFQVPFGVAVGPDGSLFVADRYNHKIRRIL